MLKISLVTENSVTLTHQDERRDCPGRYTGLASAPIVAFMSAALCSLTEDAGIAIRPTGAGSRLIRSLAEREEPWTKYHPDLERSTSFYIATDSGPWLFPSSKEDLDEVMEMAYPDWTATVAVFRGYSSLFHSEKDEIAVVRQVDENALFRIDGGVDQFILTKTDLGLDLAEVARQLVSEMNRFLN